MKRACLCYAHHGLSNSNPFLCNNFISPTNNKILKSGKAIFLIPILEVIQRKKFVITRISGFALSKMITNNEDEISFESDDHDPASNGGAAAGSMSINMSEDNVRFKNTIKSHKNIFRTLMKSTRNYVKSNKRLKKFVQCRVKWRNNFKGPHRPQEVPELFQTLSQSRKKC